MRLKIEVDGRTMVVERERYVAAKTKQLREFGYSSLTEDEVDERVGDVLLYRKAGRLAENVIAKFMEDEIICEVPDNL
jgi:hypothetical protein